MKVKVYVEGGGEGQALRTQCRRGFRRFFKRAGLSGRMPRVVACGSRNDAYRSFCTAVASAGANDFPLLLVDSEEAVKHKPWDHLKRRDDWDQPKGAGPDQAHLMVQCMEVWFLADRQCLAKFYGQGFAENSLPAQEDVEQIAKKDLYNGLKMSTRQCKTKGAYGKGAHSFAILERLDPKKVRAVSKHADKLLNTLDTKCKK